MIARIVDALDLSFTRFQMRKIVRMKINSRNVKFNQTTPLDERKYGFYWFLE
jgi:hypothetical protein